jgi:hypothetical protein
VTVSSASSWGPCLEQELEGGQYLVAVYDPEGETGAYGLTTDGEEVVTLPEGFWPRLRGGIDVNRTSLLPAFA